VLYLLGLSISPLSLSGLMLAIGIVVDDGSPWSKMSSVTSRKVHTPLEAAHQAMAEVSGPIAAIALVLCAVFVPMASWPAPPASSTTSSQ
jgi:multidrug efflux pump subunit AcrB